MTDECGLIAPMKFVTIDPEVKRRAASYAQFHADTTAVPGQRVNIGHDQTTQRWKQRFRYIGNVDLAVFVHIERCIERTIVYNHSLTIPRDLKAQRHVAVE